MNAAIAKDTLENVVRAATDKPALFTLSKWNLRLFDSIILCILFIIERFLYKRQLYKKPKQQGN